MNSLLLKSKHLRYIRYGVLSKLGLRKKWWLLEVLTSCSKIRKRFVNWRSFILDCFGLLRKKEIIYKTRSRISILTRPGTLDVGIIDEVFIKNIYGSYERFFNKDDIILDVGAHIGTFSLYISQYIKDGVIYALEPDKDNFNQLKRNIQLNKSLTIKACNIALGSRSGKRRLHLSPENNAAHSFHFGKKNPSKMVRTKTLADFVNEKSISRLKLMKLDCEGSEYEILESCSRQLLQTINMIIMEIHEMDEKHCYQSMEFFLRQNGFQLSRLHSRGNIAVAWQDRGCNPLH